MKHKFGTPNPIIMAEERGILSIVDRAKASSSNPQVIGRNGELPLRDFLNRYLPFTLRAETGHFVTASGRLSPQQDVMILDARYPLLASNPDGSVLAMLHGVIALFELKTTLRARDMKQLWANAVTIAELVGEVKEFALGAFSSIRSDAIGYQTTPSLQAIDNAYVKWADPANAALDVYVLRLPSSEQPADVEIGAELHFEPVLDDQTNEESFVPTCRLSHTPLSDVYYRLVQDAYYCLNARGCDVGDIGVQVMQYMSWATLSWDSYVSLRASISPRVI